MKSSSSPTQKKKGKKLKMATINISECSDDSYLSFRAKITLDAVGQIVQFVALLPPTKVKLLKARSRNATPSPLQEKE